jgi:phospholipid/cholesterol/gamma-HCH transport system substrate-binding protein/paraquat-inducible protein B
MSRKGNYFKLGIFVIAAVVLLLIGIFFLGAREMFRTEWVLETYFDHSVDGLDVGSPVKMMGVKIGSVREISFVPRHYDTRRKYIHVLFTIDPASAGARHPDMAAADYYEFIQKMVDEGLRLTLSSQGITGVSFLDASFHDPAEMESLPIDWKPKHAYVPAIPGTLARLGSSLDKTLENLSRVDFAAMVSQVKASLASITDLLNGELIPLVNKLKEESSPALANFRQGSEKFPEITARLNQTLQGLHDWISEQKMSMAELSEDLLVTSRNLKELAESARRDPSSILFGEPPPPSKEVK